jgi:hypothetical protein
MGKYNTVTKKIIIIFIILALAMLMYQCSSDEESFVLPMENPDTALFITNFMTSNLELESGGDTCIVSAIIVDASGSPIEGVKALFEPWANNGNPSGIISFPDDLEYALSDTNGLVYGTYSTPSDNYGDFEIHVVSGALADTVSISVIPIITSIQILTSSNSLLGDGETTLEVSARPISAVGDVVDIGVNFTIDNGYVEEDIAYTDSTGYARTILHSISTNLDISSLLRCWIDNNENKKDSTVVNYLGITVEVSAGSDTIESENDSTQIIVLVRETTSTRPIEGKTITWSSTMGNVGVQTVTDIEGISETYLSSNGFAGSAQVTADIGHGLNASTQVGIVNDSSDANEITLQLSNNSILANGSDFIYISAMVRDQSGNGMDGIGINMASSFGSITSSNGVTDMNGEVSFELISMISINDVISTLSVEIDGNSSIFANADVQFRGITLEIIDPDEESMDCDGERAMDITIRLIETSSQNPIVGEEIFLSSTLGTIDTLVVTNTLGLATSTLTSIMDDCGLSQITAILGNGEISDDLEITFVLLNIANIVFSGVTESILGDGVSTDTLTVTAFNESGGIVPDALIRLTTDAGLFPDELQQVDLITDPEGGSASIILTSQPGFLDFTAHLTATSIDNELVEDFETIIFRGITLTLSPEDDTMIANGLTSNAIQVQIKETANGNPLVDIPVDWATNLGIILQSEVTDITGSASATLLSQDGVLGTATISATYGLLNPATTTVEFIDPPPPTNISLSWEISGSEGGNSSILLNVLLTDTNSNPVENFEIEFSIDPGNIGSISPSSDLTNENGQAQVVFTYPVQNSQLDATFTATAGSISDNIVITLP